MRTPKLSVERLARFARLGALSSTILIVGTLTLLASGGARWRAGAISADSSAVVVLAYNKGPTPVEIFFKRGTTYDRLGQCPEERRCIFVVPSARLGTLKAFQVSGLSHGESVPDDSPLYARLPGLVNVAIYNVEAPDDPPSVALPVEARP